MEAWKTCLDEARVGGAGGEATGPRAMSRDPEPGRTSEEGRPHPTPCPHRDREGTYIHSRHVTYLDDTSSPAAPLGPTLAIHSREGRNAALNANHRPPGV